MQPNYPLNREVSSRLLADPETTATTLQLILSTAYGEDYWDFEEMDPVVLWRAVREDFSVTIPETSENKVNALRTATVTDIFYEHTEPFIATCLALSQGDMGDMVSGMLEDITLPECLWGIFEVGLSRDDDVDFSEEIIRLVEKEMQEAVEEGYTDFAYFVRALIEGKTTIIREFEALGVPPEAIALVRNFDETPIHDDEGNIESPGGSKLIPAYM